MHRIESDNITVTSDGKNQFKNTPPATTLNAEILNAIQEEICNVITGAGIAISRQAGDPQNQLFRAINALGTEFDIIITNQTQFNSIMERVGANQYKISDDFRGVYIKYATSGYACSGASSFLSGGDTWGYIETNNCARLVCEAGATFDFSATGGYLKVNTDDGYYENVQVVGNGGIGALTQSFLLAAHRVKYNHCNTNTRNSNTDFVGFQGSGTALHNITSSYNGCSAYTLDGSDKIYGFKDCMNLSNCNVYDIDGTTDHIYGFHTCGNITNGNVSDLDTSGSNSAYGYEACENINSCQVNDIQSAVNQETIGFNNCNQLSSCKAIDIDSTGTGVAYGFNFCDQISSCIAFTIDGAANVIGFFNCDQISSCRAEDIDCSGADAFGFRACDQISSCIAFDIDSNNNAYGFQTCDQISSCSAIDIDGSANAWGFSGCEYGAALWTAEVTNISNDWMDTVDVQITNKVSTPSIWT